MWDIENTAQNSICGTPRDPQGICLYPILLSQPIGIRLCPGSWLDTRSSKVWEGCCTPARHQPLLCIQSLPWAQSWHSPEQLTSALLRLLPSTATLHPSVRPLDMEVSPSRSTFTLPTHSLELGHLFQVSPPRRNIICSLSLLLLQFQPLRLFEIKPKWTQLFNSLSKVLPINFYEDVRAQWHLWTHYPRTRRALVAEIYPTSPLFPTVPYLLCLCSVLTFSMRNTCLLGKGEEQKAGYGGQSTKVCTCCCRPEESW